MAVSPAAPQGSLSVTSPEAASGGNIALIEDGDMIAIDIPNRSIQLQLSDAEIAARREAQKRVATVRGRRRIASVRSPLPFAPTPAGDQRRQRRGTR